MFCERPLQILMAMVQQYIEVLYDPESFFERGEEAASPIVPVLVAVFVGAVSAAAIWINFQQQSEMMSQAAGGGQQAQSMMNIAGGIGAVVALVFPFLAWLLYAGIFHGISALLDGEGEFVTTVVYTGWGLVPKVLASTVNIAATWFVLNAVSVPSEVTAQSMQTYQQSIATHPGTVVAGLLSIVVLLWSAYIWVAAVQYARDVDREDAMITVGILVAILLLIRLWSNFNVFL
jgi:hypothetical protein